MPKNERPGGRKGEKTGGPPVEVEIAFLVSRLGGRQAQAFAELLRPLDLSPKQFGLMNVVALGDGPSQQEVGAKMELDPSGLIATIDQLEDQGWLERQRSASDRRRYELRLTETGSEKLSEGRNAASARARELSSPLSAQERSTLLGILRKML